jgi:cytochrome c-type biogenesis protein
MTVTLAGSTFAGIAESGPLVAAIGVAALAGLVSFLSPCVLPLVPGYLSYVTGLAGADLCDAEGRRRGRVLAGTLLFVAGFATVFILTSVVAARIGRALLVHDRAIQVAVGVLVIVLGLAFLGAIPGLQREWRIRRLPSAGLLGAPVFGAVFALSWTPCLSPTLGAVLGLAAAEGSTGRAVTLAAAYCLGLGLPFVAFGLGFRRMLGLFQAVRRNSRWVTRIGGALLILVGLALVTGAWSEFVNWLRAAVGAGEVGI